jgi:hypothetical protein
MNLQTDIHVLNILQIQKDQLISIFYICCKRINIFICIKGSNEKKEMISSGTKTSRII